MASYLERLDFYIGRRAWRLFEITDLAWTPNVFRECNQTMLKAQWTRRLPLLQSQSPADLAASVLIDAIEDVDRLDKEKPLTVIDFCAGSGGPTAHIEREVNRRRTEKRQKPIKFKLSDLWPNLDDWIELSEQSANLSFFPNPVDAVDPPRAVTNAARVFRLFCLAFHHFDDRQAVRTLKSTLETSDGIAIVELQDRRVSSLIVMVLEFFLLLLITALWFPHRKAHLFWTYAVPVMPFIQAFDGSVSSLRTRTFEEVLELVDIALGSDAKRSRAGPAIITSIDKHGRKIVSSRRGEWQFESGTCVHTFPIGRMNWIIGKRTLSS